MSKIKTMTTIENKQYARYEQHITMCLHSCCNCGVPFALSDELDNELRKTHKTFYCPNGHAQLYNSSALTKEQQELKKLRLELSESQRSERFWNETWQKKVDENKKITRDLNNIKKRVINGGCPCCDRTFKDLLAHMKTKHPEIKAIL